MNDSAIICDKVIDMDAKLTNKANQTNLKDKVNFEIYDVTKRLTNNCNTHIVQGTFLLKNHTKNMLKKLFPDPYLKKSKFSISLN